MRVHIWVAKRERLGSILDHARTIADLPDEYLRDIGPVVKTVAIATEAENYNVIQVCYLLVSSIETRRSIQSFSFVEQWQARIPAR